MRPGTLLALVAVALAAALGAWSFLRPPPGTPLPAVSSRAAPAPPVLPALKPRPLPALPVPPSAPPLAAPPKTERAVPPRPGPTPGEPPTDPEQALVYYAELVKRADTFSPEWWEAKHALFEALDRSGQREQVRQLLENLRLVVPSLGGNESRARFAALARRVGLSEGW